MAATAEEQSPGVAPTTSSGLDSSDSSHRAHSRLSWLCSGLNTSTCPPISAGTQQSEWKSAQLVWMLQERDTQNDSTIGGVGRGRLDDACLRVSVLRWCGLLWEASWGVL